MICEVLSVGTEILLGSIVNTNSQVISESLSSIGVTVYKHSTIGDNPTRLKEAIIDSLEKSDIIIMTGGLGPTDDDLTKEIVCQVLGVELELDKMSLNQIKKIFDKNGYTMPANNLKQAYFPKNSIIIKNNNGTANGMILNINDNIIILLPGPPNECVPMLKHTVIPYLKKLSKYKFNSTYLNFIGIGESELEDKLSHLIKNQSNPTIAPYANVGTVTLRITEKTKLGDDDCSKAEEVIKEVEHVVGEFLYSKQNESIEEYIVKKMLEKGETISIAESCTGGMLCSCLVDVKGASKVFAEGVIAYDNESKINRLGVKRATIEKYGAVSEQTAREMAIGIRGDSSIGIAITGVSEGGKKEGVTFIGVSHKNKVSIFKYAFTSERNTNRMRSVKKALEILKMTLN